MKFIYIANVRIPTEKAHGIQIMQMCEAFATFGNQLSAVSNLELVVPARFNPIKKDPFDYYGVKRIFKIKRLPVIDFIWLNLPFAFVLETITFSISVFFYLLFQRNYNRQRERNENHFISTERTNYIKYILYTRGEMILGLKPFLRKKPVFWETHIKPENFNSYQKILKNLNGLIVVTKHYKQELIEKYKIEDKRILYAPDGVNLKKFDIGITKEVARERLELPLDKKIILYAGSFIPWKGTDIFLEISGFLPNDVLLVLVVGGEKENIEEFKKSINNLSITNFLILEHRPYEEIPYYLKAADVLILTGTQKSEISLHYTSPLKLFEYMASKGPILAADIPSFRDILREENAFFYKPDDAGDFVRQVNFIFENYSLAEEKAAYALEDVKEFTWQKRTEKILFFMRNILFPHL